MESLAYNYAMEDTKTMFSTANEVNLTTATEGAPGSHTGQPGSPEPGFAQSPFQARSPNDVLNMFAQEPRSADVAPPSELDELTMNFGRMGGSEINFDDVDASNHNYLNYFMQGSRAESVSSSRSNAWADGSGPRPNDQMSTFDFLVKSVSAANNYVSMLTREQLHVLQSLRPSLLFEFLQEVAKVRSDKRMRRALPNECAFCKNNGENEECYSQHALKDWRGRVLCPVLRAFRCPRCGATGDHAHTIKYCPENSDAERSNGLGARRRAPPSASLPLSSGGGMSSGMGSGMSSMPQTPTHGGPPPSPSTFNSGLWSSFGLN